MFKDMTIITNTQEFSELYLEFLRNNLKIATVDEVSDAKMAKHYSALYEFSSGNETVEEGTIHMQEYAINNLKKTIESQEQYLNKLKEKNS